MKSNRNCPLCNNHESTIIKNVEFHFPIQYRIPSSYNIVSCNECGMCYADTTASLEDYDHYYKNCNVYSGLHYDVSSRNDALLKLTNRYCQKNISILDMGCGNGEWLIVLKKDGYNELFGIDPSPDSIQSLLANGIQGTIGSIFLSNDRLFDKFSCVYLLSVLEHLLHPREAINILYKYLKTDGLIILEIPDYSKAHLTDAPIPNMFNQEHINYFSPVTFTRILSLEGFNLLKLDPYVLMNDNIETHGLLGIFQKCNKFIEEKQVEKDDLAYHSITQFLQMQLEKEEIYNKIISAGVGDTSGLYIWGTGAFVSRLMCITNLTKYSIIAFIDNNPLKQGKQFMGYDVIAPTKAINSDRPIIIASMLYTKEICEQINRMGLRNRVITLVGK